MKAKKIANKFRNNRLLSLLLVLMMLVPIIGSFGTSVNAANYGQIKLNVPWYCQRRYGDCGISSIAMVEAYEKGYGTNDATVYNAVYNYNNQSIVLSNYANLGYTTLSNSLEVIYQQLQNGNPVIVYRTGNNHYSVIYGYNGSTTNLEKKGFLVYNTFHSNDYSIVGPEYASNAGFTNLESWLSGNTWMHTMVKTADKIPLASKIEPSKTLTLSGVNYPTYKKTGDPFQVFGTVSSPYGIKWVEAYVRNSSGANMFWGGIWNMDDNEVIKDKSIKNFNINSVDANMKFSSLPAGNYEYIIDAGDERGYFVCLSYKFTVGTGETATRTGASAVSEHHCDSMKGTAYTWDSGVITKAATCTTDGIKTYTCRECGKTKTEVIKAAGEHDWGSWKKSDADRHEHICNVCGTSEYKDHNWNSGVVTREPTATSTGIRLYTCSDCNAEKSEIIPMLKPETNIGDVNGDGEIDAADAGLISRYDAGLIELSEEQLKAADVNGDGEVDAADAGLISRYDAGFISSF